MFMANTQILYCRERAKIVAELQNDNGRREPSISNEKIRIPLLTLGQNVPLERLVSAMIFLGYSVF